MEDPQLLGIKEKMERLEVNTYPAFMCPQSAALVTSRQPWHEEQTALKNGQAPDPAPKVSVYSDSTASVDGLSGCLPPVIDPQSWPADVSRSRSVNQRTAYTLGATCKRSPSL